MSQRAEPEKVWWFEKCPVCRRFEHAADCPMLGLMALEWSGVPPDLRARDAQA